jgi:iron complex outermembrane receptor protein
MRHLHRFAFPLLVGLPSCAALAQEPVQRVEVTGSSIKRLDAETALPVQVLTQQDIARSGAENVEQLLQIVSAIVSSGANMASAASGATTGGISSVSLRGLTSLRTLVLVDGRRLAPYGIGFTNDSVSVDVNSIPLAAIQRIEVLKDGASAIYGSDAIAGVINFILRSDYRGLEASATAGNTTRGGADLRKGSLTWGGGDVRTDGWNLMLVASLQHEGSLFGAQRSFARSSIDVAHGNDTSSGNTFPANIAPVDGSFPSTNPTAASGCVAPYSTLDPLRSQATCRFDPASMVTLLPATERASLFATATLKLGDTFEGFAEVSFNRNLQHTVVQPVPLSDQFNLPANNPLYNLAPYAVPGGISTSTILLKSTSPFYPTAFVESLTGGPTPDLLVRYRAAESGNRDISDISEAPRMVLGVRGTASGWDVDAALLRSASYVREQDTDGWPILTKLLPFLNSGQVNFFGPNSPQVDAQIRADNFVGTAWKVDTTLTSMTTKATHDLWTLAGGASALAIGGEVRQETYAFSPSTALAEGDIGGYGGNFAAVTRSRTVDATFAEIDLPIAKTFEVDAAGRFDHYQGVGNSFTPKAGLRWQPAPQVLVRAAVSQGFRAPSLADLYAPETTGVTIQGQTDPVRCPITHDGVKDCATQFPTLNGGNPNLVPEKSTSLTLGLVLQPARDLDVSLDGFKITLYDTISGGIAPAVILGDLAKYGSYVTRGAPDPQYPDLPGPIVSIDQRNLNTGQARLLGYDFDAHWRLKAGEDSRLTLSIDGTYFAKFDTQNPDGTFSTGVDQVNSSTGGVIPRLKSYQSATWARGPWESTLALNWQKHYRDLPSTEDPTAVRRVGDLLTVDAHVAWSGLPRTTLALGVRNLFDRNPPYSNAGGQTSFQSGYDQQYADPRGRFVYVTATHAFQ